MYQGVCGKLSWCKWRRHDDDMPMACWQHREGIATTWRRHGDHMATAWRRHCDDMATTRRPHGDDMATTWRRGQDDNDDGENDDDGDDEDDGDDHETELYRVWCRHRYTIPLGNFCYKIRDASVPHNLKIIAVTGPKKWSQNKFPKFHVFVGGCTLWFYRIQWFVVNQECNGRSFNFIADLFLE